MPKFVVAVYGRGGFVGNYLVAGKSKPAVLKKTQEMFLNTTHIVVGAEVGEVTWNEPDLYTKVKLMVQERAEAIDALKIVMRNKTTDYAVDVFCEDLDITALRRILGIHAKK
jgi:hypothetical protein